MELNESFAQTAKREVAEEVGLKIKNVRFGAITNNFFPEEKIHSVTIWLLSDYASGEPAILEPHKVTALAWADFSSLPHPLLNPGMNY